MSFSFINFFLDTILKKYKYPTASGSKYTKPKITTKNQYWKNTNIKQHPAVNTQNRKLQQKKTILKKYKYILKEENIR
jgi:hypothetical protein